MYLSIVRDIKLTHYTLPVDIRHGDNDVFIQTAVHEKRVHLVKGVLYDQVVTLIDGHVRSDSRAAHRFILLIHQAPFVEAVALTTLHQSHKHAAVFEFCLLLESVLSRLEPSPRVVEIALLIIVDTIKLFCATLFRIPGLFHKCHCHFVVTAEYGEGVSFWLDALDQAVLGS